MLEVKNLHKSYHNGAQDVEVLKGINLDIERAKFIAIVGPSGAGKSTLLHLLGGLDNPTEGEVILEGENLYQINDATLSKIRNRKIGFVFQFYHLLSEFTVLENVLMPVLVSGQRPAASGQFKEEALKLLGTLGLGERINHFPAQLSGGERQRVAVVRALINKPHLLLCDEPTGNLDSKSGEEFISLLKKINLQDQMTIILVTHNLELAKSADCIYNLRDGILVN